MPNVHVIDPLTGEARRDGHILLLHVQNQRHEPFDIRRRYVIPVGPLNQGLSRRSQQTGKTRADY